MFLKIKGASMNYVSYQLSMAFGEESGIFLRTLVPENKHTDYFPPSI